MEIEYPLEARRLGQLGSDSSLGFAAKWRYG